MAKRKLSEQQEIQKQSGREMSVYKRDDMIQKGRHQLSVREQRCVLFAISKIKPTDDIFQEYTFELKDFYAICGLSDESYTELKAILLGLKQKCWYIELPDGSESAVSWLEVARTNKKSGKVTVGFHRDMMPFLLHLTGKDDFYTGYSLQYVLPMSSQYGPRLYELLKSYQKNNKRWFFEVDKLRKLLDAENYSRWPDFRRYALEPAVEEINKFTDLKIAWRTEKEGRKVTKVDFFMDEKTSRELVKVRDDIQEALDGQINIFDILQETDQDPFLQFEKERLALHKAEKEAKEASKKKIGEWLDPK